MAYHDKYKKVLDEIWKDKVELDGMIMKEEEEAIKKVKGRISKNLLDRVLQLHYPFSLPERLKANNTIRVNR
ncbi:hypothetical protein Tco_1314930 [Tanacetum coccineum]